MLDQLSDDSSDDWSDAEELEDWTLESSQTLCLFCSQTFKSITDCLSHTKDNHCVDLVGICVTNRLDSLEFIKLINYTRLKRPEGISMRQLIESKVYLSDEYMKPVLTEPMDPFLTFDIESEHKVLDKELTPTISNGELDDYKHLSQEQLINRLKQSEEHMKSLEKQISDMKGLVNKCMDEDISVDEDVNVKQLSTSDDSHYISSYSHFGIHYEMLSDTNRTQSYEQSILKNQNFFKDKTVLDIGCGTGILSLFAAKAGARLVVAVDHSDVIYKAMDIAIENGYNSHIKFIKDKLESINWQSHGLPQKYDIIISEWMGYFLLFEGMLDSILYARQHCLNDGGALMPNRTSLSIAGINDMQLQNRCINFWDNVYGFKMTSMKSEVLNEALVESVNPDVIATNSFVIQELDLMRCLLEETQHFETDFQLICKKDDTVMAIVGWFDCHFDLESFDHKVLLSTSPFSVSTHWKQTVFLLKKPILCKTGDTIDGNIKVYRNKKDIRSLVVHIVINDCDKQIFYLS